MTSVRLWGGRFQGGPSAIFEKINASFSYDYRLLAVDLAGSKAWADALGNAGILSETEVQQIVDALVEIARLAEDPAYLKAALAAGHEDVHSFVESELIRLLGDTGRKLHTGRSRNDQVATDFRLYVKGVIEEILASIAELKLELARKADEHKDLVLPGYTHLQRAQPILFAHYLLSFHEMLSRDEDRFREAGRRLDLCPLASGALAGTAYPVDREALAQSLGFSAPTANSLDAVSDRDFVLDFLYAASVTMVHLSRLAEDLILYSSEEFGFVTLSDEVTSGSSLMPQKKNPDGMELVRGKTGRVAGHLVALLTTLKGLPSSYNKDLQEDKEALFDTASTLTLTLAVTRVTIATLTPHAEKMRAACVKGHLDATDLADYLVAKGVPFRRAHEIVGELVLEALSRGVTLSELPLEKLRPNEISPDVYEALKLEKILAKRSALGGTAPERVATCVARALGTDAVVPTPP